MEDQDRVSQASSVATISYFPVKKDSDGKVQTFGKRCQAAKRDPNCPVVIRGWLNKKDSSGLKLWKRRWFVLSNYCLFYYKDSREESVLGSIPLPSYKILFCTPRECKNRKFTFKVVHQGMRSYFFSADTQEDMLGWVRALSQSATMEPESSLYRRCSSYQDFTQIGGSSESEDFPRSPSDGEGPPQKHRHVSRTLSEPSHLSGGRVGTSHTEQRGRRSVHQRNSSPSARTPSPLDYNRRRAFGPHPDDPLHYISGDNTPPTQAEMSGTGSLPSRAQLGSRPHTPVGRVDIRPQDDPVMMPQNLYYAPASPKLEFKSTPTTPVSERWQNLSKPTPTYGSVHPISAGRRPLGKSYSTGANADLLPPLPPSSRAAHASHPTQHHHHHHHHHRNHLSVCVLPAAMSQKPDPRETQTMRPLESEADAVLTRLCGCDKLLQSLSVELAQLQLDKDSVHCALEVSRLQLEEWKIQGPQAYEEALMQKALLQEELVTIRARMCDVSLEMDRVWSQYERMESELSVIRSHLQHICSFGMPQEQSQAQRELWMMEDILAGLKVNRDHFRFLLGLQRHHLYQPTSPHPGSPGSPTERLPMDMDQEPPVRPPLPQELQENNQMRDQSHGWTETPYEPIYSHAVDPAQRRGNSQPDLLNVKSHRDTSESHSSAKWTTPDSTSHSTKKIKMSEEEQIERMKKNQGRLTNKKPPLPTTGALCQTKDGETKEEAPFPLRVTRVVTSVLPSSLVARRVSVEDPPPELDAPLPEQISHEPQQRQAEQSHKMLNRSSRRLLPESPDQKCLEMHQGQPIKKTIRQQHQGLFKSATQDSQPEVSRDESTEASRSQGRDQAGLGNRSASLDVRTEDRHSALLTPELQPDLCLTPEQREAKLRRVERIRERVIRSAARESVTAHNQHQMWREGQVQVPPDTARKPTATADHDHGNGVDNIRSPECYGRSQEVDDGHECVRKSKSAPGNKTQHKDYSGKKGVAKTKITRPASPYHISSVTVYQRNGSKGFMSYKDKEEQKLEEPDTDDNESNFSSSDLRAKWFLSTSQWQGFMPLQIPEIESLGNEEASDVDNQSPDPEVTDSNEMLSTVTQSLEKMKENHSLFYKIACDISISDTDITRNDGNSNTETTPKAEKEETLITESVPPEETRNVGSSSDLEVKDPGVSSPSLADENSTSSNSTHTDTAPENPDPAVNTSTSQVKEANICEENPQTECENASKEESPIEVREINHGASVKPPDDCSKSREEDNEAKELEEKKMDQERPVTLKKSNSLRTADRKKVHDRGNSDPITPSGPLYESGGVIRSASFGKARVTVLRTSL